MPPVTPTGTASLAGMEAAARFTSETNLASWVVVRRGAGVVRHAQVLAESAGINLARVDIGAATIALRFTSRSPSSLPAAPEAGAGVRPARANAARALVSRAWRLVRKPPWRRTSGRFIYGD